MRGRVVACAAGACGALASVSGKLVTDDMAWVPPFCGDQHMWIVTLVLRTAFLGITLALNSVMWTLFVESLQFLNSSEASVLNVGSNILLSGALGWLCFGESVSAMWWCGASLIVTGIAVMNASGARESEEKKAT